jgi:hypothetical protein
MKPFWSRQDRIVAGLQDGYTPLCGAGGQQGVDRAAIGARNVVFQDRHGCVPNG